jgi:hypothetical protein
MLLIFNEYFEMDKTIDEQSFGRDETIEANE